MPSPATTVSDHVGPLDVRELLDEDVDLAAARQADLERHVVGDAVRQESRLATREHFLRREDDVVLDAAAGDGAD